MICFWSKLVNKGQFTRTDHKFLVRGHTYLPNDRDFAHIEKKKDSAVIHLPNDWERIKDACTARPFQIQKMTKENFFDFTSITKQFTMRKKDATGAPVLISTANWLNFGKGEDGGKIVSHPGEFWMSHFSIHMSRGKRFVSSKDVRKCLLRRPLMYLSCILMAILLTLRKWLTFKRRFHFFLHSVGTSIALWLTIQSPPVQMMIKYNFFFTDTTSK